MGEQGADKLLSCGSGVKVAPVVADDKIRACLYGGGIELFKEIRLNGVVRINVDYEFSRSVGKKG